LVKEPPVVIGMLVNGADGAGNVLHTFESNRPVNDQITRVEGKTGENLNIELVLKTAQAAEEKRRKMNKILEQQKFLRERSRQAEIQRISQQHLQQHLRDMHMV
jgi:hypothetical protein